MQEIVELRVVECFAPMLFADNEGERRSLIRKVTIETNDPRFAEVGRLQRHLRATQDDSFFLGWQISRRYSEAELTRAACFQLIVPTVFEPPGEACGTIYDETRACPICGSGAVQIDDLCIDLRKAPEGTDIARTIANELIISQHLAELMVGTGLTGFQLRPVRHSARFENDPIDLSQTPAGRDILERAAAAGAPHPTGKFFVWLNRAENHALIDRARKQYAAAKADEDHGKRQPVWYQFAIDSVSVDIVPPTRAGIDPFDDDPEGHHRCPRGHLLGLNLLSELSIRAMPIIETDFVCSRQFIGVRRGSLRPTRMITVSPKVHHLFESERIKGADFEVVHLV
jgi:hypothetical protein